jgi:uncharacterized protein YecT (DUF1311 family)
LTISLFILFYSTLCLADVSPKSLNYFLKKGLPAKFAECYDPGYIVIELESGDVLNTKYSGIDFETIYAWENQVDNTGVKRDVRIIYTIEDGLMVKDLETNLTFKLLGSPNIHPIDIAGKECEVQNDSTMGIKACKNLILEAWESELERAYESLGGKNNIKLTKAHLAWIDFRDEEINYLQSQYGSRRGTIWGIIYMNYVVGITKHQAQLLQSISINEE